MKKIIIIIASYLLFSEGMQSEINPDYDDDNCDCVFSDQCKDFGNDQPKVDIRQLNDINYINPCKNSYQICCDRDNLINSEITETSTNSTESNTPARECGISNSEGLKIALRNTNNEAQYAEFPWMIEILIDLRILSKPLFKYLGGGSLIHPLFVLTAAHKVHNRDLSQLKVRAGEWDRNSVDEPYKHQDRKVILTTFHPEFERKTLHNGVALLLLDSPMEINNHVNTICIQPYNSNFDNSRCIVTGWGQDAVEKGEILNILKKVEVPIRSYHECERQLETRLGRKFKLHRSFICAGGEAGQDACFGDGGSPMVCQIPGTANKYYQVGIVAAGIGCGDINVPGIYIEVKSFVNWIHSVMDDILYRYKGA